MKWRIAGVLAGAAAVAALAVHMDELANQLTAYRTSQDQDRHELAGQKQVLEKRLDESDSHITSLNETIQKLNSDYERSRDEHAAERKQADERLRLESPGSGGWPCSRPFMTGFA